ncbi:MAG: DUF1428 family protein [Alphaproteobacteria bacterium]|nr:DUF1428 family protein [Alphaproteobacteria bacterium]
MAYVDGFVLAVPKDTIEAYKELARQCLPIWKEYGATGYAECIGDDTPYGEMTSFPRAVQAREDEVVVFSWIVYPSKEVREAANLKIMQDPRISKMMNPPPFDGRRMIHGGFVPFLQL